jgi:hypothetical protein
MAVIPAYQIINGEACSRGDVHGIRLASFGKNAGSQIGLGQHLHSIDERIHLRLRIFDRSTQYSSVVTFRENDFC